MTSYDPNQNPYGGQGGDPNAYPQGAGGMYAPGVSPFTQSTEKNSLGGWALGLGIASIVCCGLFTGIPALICGFMGMQAANEGRATNKGMAIAGMVLGGLSIVWTIIAISSGLLTGIFNSGS